MQRRFRWGIFASIVVLHSLLSAGWAVLFIGQGLSRLGGGGHGAPPGDMLMGGLGPLLFPWVWLIPDSPVSQLEVFLNFTGFVLGNLSWAWLITKLCQHGDPRFWSPFGWTVLAYFVLSVGWFVLEIGMALGRCSIHGAGCSPERPDMTLLRNLLFPAQFLPWRPSAAEYMALVWLLSALFWSSLLATGCNMPRYLQWLQHTGNRESHFIKVVRPGFQFLWNNLTDLARQVRLRRLQRFLDLLLQHPRATVAMVTIGHFALLHSRFLMENFPVDHGLRYALNLPLSLLLGQALSPDGIISAAGLDWGLLLLMMLNSALWGVGAFVMVRGLRLPLSHQNN